MKLLSIELENFRQFKDRHHIDFADGRQNTTILFGINGTGKTSLFRAMMFGLFGLRRIEQDEVNADIHLVNSYSLESNNGRPTSATVEIKFVVEEQVFTLKRRITAYKSNNQVFEKEDETFLSVLKPDNSTLILNDPLAINTEIDRVIDSKNRSFFFFDAEQIDTLSDMRDDVKKVIRSGILKLLQIELLDTGVDRLSKIKKRIKAEIEAKSKNKTLTDLINTQEKLATKLSNKQDEKNSDETELSEATTALSELEAKLDQNAEISEIHKQIREKRNSIRLVADNINSLNLNAVSTIFRGLGTTIIADEIASVTDNLTTKLLSEDNFVPKQVLELSLLNDQCAICKSDLSVNVTGKSRIQNMIEHYKHSNLLPSILLIQNANDDLQHAKSQLQANLVETIRNIDAKKSDIEMLEDEISELESKESEILSSDMNYEQLESQRSSIKDDIEKIKNRKQATIGVMKDTEDEINRLEIQIKELQSKEEGLKNDSMKYDFVDQLQTKLQKITDEYCDEMKTKLNHEALTIFRTLIDAKDFALVDRIVVNDRYEIEVHGLNGVINADLSQGQKQIIALSFIAGLSRLASGRNGVISFPLFMDTPFGRISGTNRDNLIKNMPSLVSQWILLFTDTEFTTAEERVFKQNERLGKTYRFEQIGVGQTKIRNVPLSEKLSTR
jgi:DNA sulfur modification protein DndD